MERLTFIYDGIIFSVQIYLLLSDGFYQGANFEFTFDLQWVWGMKPNSYLFAVDEAMAMGHKEWN